MSDKVKYGKIENEQTREAAIHEEKAKKYLEVSWFNLKFSKDGFGASMEYPSNISKQVKNIKEVMM